MIEITFNLDYTCQEPLYIQLYKYIKQEILSGRMEPGARLPSKRKLSLHLEVSQNTIETAYEQLQAEGYVESFPRKGVYVKEVDKDVISTTNHEPSSNYIERADNDDYEIDFSHGKIALDFFPFSIWRKLTVQSLFEDQSSMFLNGERQGELLLRQEIAKYLYQSRGVRCSPSQIIIGAGTQYLISLLTMIIGRDAVFSMEEPGFHRTREALKDQGVKVNPVTLDDEGLCIQELEKSTANITYVTPSHQFPMGIIMPITRRMELLKWADNDGRYIIEDDYDGEFRYKGKPIPSLQGLDNREKVIYLGTFSKSLIPSIRLSYMVLPPKLLSIYHQHFSIYKQTVSRLHQHTLWLFMKNGHWERHLNKMRTVYRRKQQTLVDAIEHHFGKNAAIIGGDSGLHLLLSVQNQMSEKELIESAMDKKVKVYPTSVYYENYDAARQQSIVLLGFGGVTEQEIHKGVQLLREAWL
ncbi:MocR-like pyridoxine biosynthesis transcription factor PdxR [Litchfieldia alkalitelluris]|uniref:MocR-like pyridoxine biosynthesis transcription factor PdxR n=1 Tax=Litchfieldia alkalitelluris TaxID=304268 RepID=UPI00099678AA|nr:PLP-dependent aminotransferase family protein [Litchfieldia alkalitelluris]